MNLYQPTISGSLTVSGSVVVDGTIVMSSGSISGTASLAENSLLLNGLNSGSFVSTGSYNTFSGSVSSRLVTQENASGSFAAQSASLSTRVTNLEVTSSTVSSSFASTSGSIAGRVNIIETSYATTGSNNFTKPQQISDVSNAISFTSTASLYTDGGLRVTRDSFISGTAYFNNVVVYGTSSIEYITSSQLAIGTNIITLNTDTPAIRYGGISVFDSGSNNQSTGSLFWDSEKDKWIYSNPSGSTYDGGMLISGPRNSSGLGNEVGTTSCALMMGQGGDHITSSGIFSYSNATCFYGNSFISASGAACFAGTVCTSTLASCGPVLAGGAVNIDSALAVQVSSGGSGTQKWFGANKNGAYGLLMGYAETDSLSGVGAYIRQVTSDPLHFVVSNTTTALSISSAAISCFSNTVCAPAFVGTTVCSTMMNAGCIGIGTTSQNTILEVNKTISFTNIDDYGQLAIKTTTGANGNLLNLSVDETNNLSFIQSLKRGTDSTPLILQRYGGRVGIGNICPTARLHVGTGNQSAINGADTKIHIAECTLGGRAALLTLASNCAGVCVEGQFESSAEIFADSRVILGSTSNHPLVIRTNNVERIRVTTNGLIGINTNNPFSFGSTSGMVDVRSQNPTSVSGVFISNSDASARIVNYINCAAGAFIGTSTFHYLDIGTCDTSRLRISTTGIACFSCQVCSPSFIGGTINGTISTMYNTSGTSNGYIFGTSGTQREQFFMESRTLCLTAGATTEIGCVNFDDGAGLIEANIIGHISGESVAAKYILPVQYSSTGGSWTQAVPILGLTTYDSTCFALDYYQSNNISQLRLRRVGTSPNNAVYTIGLRILGNNFTYVSCACTATGVSAPSAIYGASTNPSYAIDFVVVGGGGGGGGAEMSNGFGGGGGAGGAGGFLASSISVNRGSSYPITIGTGGVGGCSRLAADGSGLSGCPGTFSSAFGFIAIGGGGGGGDENGGCQTGGSGGGQGGDGGGSAGVAVIGQGCNGGTGGGRTGGGGGGASATGNNGGSGGAGRQWLDGCFYAGGGGGGGGGNNQTLSVGGNGGGGTGSRAYSGGGTSGEPGGQSTAGCPNTGGGGGGAGAGYLQGGQAGGTGIAVIRYFGPTRGSGGTISSCNGYTYHRFTSSGTFTA